MLYFTGKLTGKIESSLTKKARNCIINTTKKKGDDTMIPLSSISRLPQEQPQPYVGRRVVLWGAEEKLQEIITILGKFSISATEFCHHQERFWAQSLHGKLVLSPELLLSLYPDKDTLVVQLALSPEEEPVARQWLKEQGYPWVVATQEAQEILGYLQQDQSGICHNLPLIQQNNLLKDCIKAEEYLLTEEGTPLFLCLPPKTGDHSLIQTFLREGISHHFIFHQPAVFSQLLLDGPVKVITAVRDPIAENISFLYQVLGDLSHSITAVDLCENRCKDFFLPEHGDVQGLFLHLCDAIEQGACYGAAPIQLFLSSFAEHLLDITAYPFQVDKGYTVIEQGNLSLFVFQIEKLNHLLPELSQFLGKEISSLERGNNTQDKWLADSYGRAIEELRFPEAYVHHCYEAPWVAHCYGQEKLAEMKSSWMSRIL